MSRLIIVDGYNLMHAWSTKEIAKVGDLERLRNRILERLGAYKRIRKLGKLICVFDAWRAGELSPTRDFQHGIEIVFSARNEKADDRITELAAEYKSQATIVSSDRFLQSRVEAYGCLTISSDELLRKIEEALIIEARGGEDDLEEEKLQRPISGMTKKRGNPCKASKRERRKQRAMKKM